MIVVKVLGSGGIVKVIGHKGLAECRNQPSTTYVNLEDIPKRGWLLVGNGLESDRGYGRQWRLLTISVMLVFTLALVTRCIVYKGA